ncbi:helix-turn-helix domain-containing protein [Collinsella intestinalis]|uniref:helix-turn-helix domain-containing protein n=1 Tax=Collinsella intestinalis TaxID=147207 RepID=UPI001956C67A|nr:helix-turn-helix transcriptional regulator [Collinsella intestinalis]MBM6907730.1 helix-turn-helix transcriptional regulator [Collinsella intestinalis]
MEIGQRIRELRAAQAMSQDDLAARVYVSRQTISSWENNKTYPDVQSLLLLSDIFDVTVDSLIKGDVDTMTETIDRDVQTMKRLSYVMTVFILLMVAALIWLSVQLSVWDWSLEQTVPTAVLALVLWGIAMFAEVWADRIKRDHDLITYQEILSFWHGEPVDRDTERGRRERLIPRWMRVIRTIGMALIAAAIGAFVGYWGSSIVTSLLG